ncbi:calcium:proton antiporter [Methylibium petroleiphilum]|uniref:Ca2+/H+ antiporter n=1 Tax=Methylibium petroleiphilum (strain ATCC BAA-1232 / LMG 22953 / PM1) TaxID=420662 RepID=A2SEH0_METPP|nr:ionic transporter y4hA [Methylibium petroleiphilum]ABM93959.1 Ca2+/H+ antiporter [Methylibium petroleiphilum PM1]
MPRWALLLPLAAAALLGASLALPMNAAIASACAVALIGAVIAAVHHAEVVAHRVGEPFGTLVLAIAITVIEVALIVSMMLAGGEGKAELPRDTIFSAVMIICTGVVGICLLVGGLHHHEQSFQLDGANSALAALVAMAGLSLVLPSFTTSSDGGTYTISQLTFVAVSSLVLWAVFVFVQTVRHRDYFLPPTNADDEDIHAKPPSNGQAWASFGLLLIGLVSVVGLAKQLSPTIEAAVAAAGAPKAVIGIAIALLVLLPETWAAVRAARADRLQTSMNLALGSALASIGLTIPVVVVAAVLLDLPLVLGLAAKDLVLLLLTFIVGAITLGTGRTNLMQGAVHLVLFAAFLFLSLVP